MENLVRTGKLSSLKPAPEEVSKLLGASRRNLKDAHVKEISPETQLDTAYKCIIQCALAALTANGFRPSPNELGHHVTLIQSLPKIIGLSNDRMIVLDKLRRMRNLNDYSGDSITGEEAAACKRAAKALLEDVEKWFKRKHPDMLLNTRSD